MTEEQLDQTIDAIDAFYEKLVNRAEFFPETAMKMTTVAIPTLIGIVQMEGYSSE